MPGRIFIGSGHGADNASVGTYDPGACFTLSDGTKRTEAAFVRTLTPQVIALLKKAGLDVQEIPSTGSLGSRIDWLIDRAKPDDWAIHLHMNAGAATGTEVIYDDQREELRPDAQALAKAISQGTGLRNRGVRRDTQTPRHYLGFVSRPNCRAFILELGFIGTEDDVARLTERGASAVAGALLLAVTGTPPPNPSPPPFMATPEQQAAFQRMKALGVYTDATPTTRERYETAVLFSRLVNAADVRYVQK